MQRFFSAVCVVACVASLGIDPVTAEEAPLAVPEVRLPLFATAPTIDGKVDEKEWQGATRMERFGWGAMLSPPEASFWVGCDGKELFVAVVSETPPGGKLKATVEPAQKGGDARTWSDDSIEMILDPLRTDSSPRRKLYHANINSQGAIADTSFLASGGGEAWRGGWRVANGIVGDRWHFEAALPLADMGTTAADLAKPFGMRICRNWQQSRVANQTEWGSRKGAFLQRESMPVVHWDAAAPVVQVLQLQDPGAGKVHVRVAVRNPGKAPLPVKVELRAVPKSSAPAAVKENPVIAPGATAEFDLANSAMKEDVFTSLLVTNPDGDKIFYRREFNWRPDRPEEVWELDEGASKRVAFDLAYYPYHDSALVRVNVASLENRDQVRGGRVVIRSAKGGPEVAKADLPPFKEYKSLHRLALPKLSAGEYEAVVELDGAGTEPVRIGFVRNIMPWEHNNLGKSDVVIPPFTPIKVEGRKVSTVLRDHALNELGLFDQVTTLGKPILAGPMRLEVKAGGKTTVAQGQGLSFTEQKPTRAAFESKWKGGPLAGTAGGVWDFDGLLKYTLDIEPSAGPIEGVTLVIPLDDKLAPLFHACTDGLRFNLAGSTPKGEGRVWDGTKAPRNAIIGSYVPYIWLGAEERGLAVFGENDRGWITADGVPCQELVRRGGVLELRLNLVAGPATIAKPRRIVIGFQATPVKPMPEGWRRWTMGTGRTDTRNLNFFGSCYRWGSLTPCLDVYPLNQDFRVWEQLKKTKATGAIDQAFLKEWISLFPENRRSIHEAENTCGFRQMKGNPKHVLVYTNARGVRFDTPEGATFLNEWHRDLFPTRNWQKDLGVAYDLNPCESFRDYAMHYYKKMLDTFVDAIYWDDIFLQSCFHVGTSEAYENDDGSIQPMAGLWDMRELIRRSAVLFHEQGKVNANMPHITNTALVPVLAFAGTHYTWEERTGIPDFQDRFPRDYLRTESIGLQCGNVPFGMLLMHGIADKEGQKRLERTATGVCLTHEVKLQGGPWNFPVYFGMMDKLFDYGYGLPEVKVSRYWDEGHPVAVSGIDASTLVCAKPGSALVVVCDWAGGGKASLRLDRKALSLEGGLKATDLEAGQPLTIDGDAVTFEMPKHEFKLILVEASGPKKP